MKSEQTINIIVLVGSLLEGSALNSGYCAVYVVSRIEVLIAVHARVAGCASVRQCTELVAHWLTVLVTDF